MTDEELQEIKALMEDPVAKWNILSAQFNLKKLMTEVERLRERLSVCAFCGNEIAEGAGGHTSSCYERMLNEREFSSASFRPDGLIVELDKVVVESTPYEKNGQPFYEAYQNSALFHVITDEVAPETTQSPVDLAEKWRGVLGEVSTATWWGCARCDAGYDSGPLEQECTCKDSTDVNDDAPQAPSQCQVKS